MAMYDALTYEELLYQYRALETYMNRLVSELHYTHVMESSGAIAEDESIDIEEKFRIGCKKIEAGKKRKDQKLIREGQEEVAEASEELEAAERSADTPEKKRKLSKVKKIAIAAGTSLLIAVLAYAGFKNKDRIKDLLSKLKKTNAADTGSVASNVAAAASTAASTPVEDTPTVSHSPVSHATISHAPISYATISHAPISYATVHTAAVHTATVPKVTVPKITVPKITVPKVTIPQAIVPHVAAPQVENNESQPLSHSESSEPRTPRNEQRKPRNNVYAGRPLNDIKYIRKNMSRIDKQLDNLIAQGKGDTPEAIKLSKQLDVLVARYEKLKNFKVII